MILQNLMVVLGMDSKQFKTEADRVKARTKAMTDMFKGMAATLVAVKLASIIKGFADAMVEFEHSVTKVHTLLDEGTFRKYGKDIEEGAMRTLERYNFTIQDVNGAMFDAVSAGVEAGKATEFLDSAAKLAVGGVTGLNTAVDGMTSVMNAYNIATEDASQVANAFFVAQQKGKTTVALLASNIGKVAPIAKTAGVSLEELLALTSQLTLGGLSTEEATTALRASISALINPAAEARKKFDELGIQYGSAALSGGNLINTLGRLGQVAETNSDELSKLIPNVRAFTGLASIASQTSLKNYDEIVNKIRTDTNALTQAYERQSGTLKEVAGVYRNQVQMAYVRILKVVGSPAAGLIKAMITYNNWLKETVSNTLKWVKSTMENLPVIGGLIDKIREKMKQRDLEKFMQQQLHGQRRALVEHQKVIEKTQTTHIKKMTDEERKAAAQKIRISDMTMKNLVAMERRTKLQQLQLYKDNTEKIKALYGEQSVEYQNRLSQQIELDKEYHEARLEKMQEMQEAWEEYQNTMEESVYPALSAGFTALFESMKEEGATAATALEAFARAMGKSFLNSVAGAIDSLVMKGTAGYLANLLIGGPWGAPAVSGFSLPLIAGLAAVSGSIRGLATMMAEGGTPMGSDVFAMLNERRDRPPETIVPLDRMDQVFAQYSRFLKGTGNGGGTNINVRVDNRGAFIGDSGYSENRLTKKIGDNLYRRNIIDRKGIS